MSVPPPPYGWGFIDTIMLIAIFVILLIAAISDNVNL